MKIDRLYADRRLIALIVSLILVAGLGSIATMPRMEDPVLRRRVALINTRMPGADAERVEALISEKIEDALRDIEEIKELRSVSRSGISTISIELLDSVMDTDSVWSRVRSKVEDAIANLPAEAARPAFEEMDVRAYALIAGLTWQRSEPVDIPVLRRLAIDLQDRLQNLPGTDSVDRFGDPGQQLTVEVDPTAAAAIGLTPKQVADVVASYDAKQAAGEMRRNEMQMAVEVGNRFESVAHVRSIPIQSDSVSFVPLHIVADINYGVTDPADVGANLDGADAVVLGAMVRPDYRIDHWTANAQRALDDFKAELPAGIEIETVLRQSDYVDDRLESLLSNLFIGGVAVSLVVCLLMGWRSALLVTMTLPLASLMVMFGLSLMNIPVHQMSITGLIISLGLLIDNAIVIVDEVKAKMRDGYKGTQAAWAATSHLAIPLLGSTITTALAFAPIALMPGPAGEFVGAIAISVILAISASFFLAMTIIPAFSILLLKLESKANPRRWLRFTDWWREGISIPPLTRMYHEFLMVVIGRPWIGIIICLIVPITGFLLAPTLRDQFFPPSGRDQFHVTIESPSVYSVAQTRQASEKVDQVLRHYGVERIDWFYGESAPQFYYNVIPNRRGTRNYAQGLVKIPTGINPTDLIAEIQDELRAKLASCRVLVRQLEQGPPFGAPIEARVFGPDIDQLRQIGQQVRQRLTQLDEVVFTRSDLSEVLPTVSINVDPESARTAGWSPAEIANHFRFALDGQLAGNILEDNEEIPVLVRVANQSRGDLQRISNMELMKTRQDNTVDAVPIDAVADVSVRPRSAAILRFNRQRMDEVAAYVRAGVLPSEVQAKIDQNLRDYPIEMPAGYSIEFGGVQAKQDDAVGNLFSTVGILAVIMVAALVLSLGTFGSAGIIGFVAILSVGLGMISLVMGNYPFGFMSIIGTMGLMGVAINDSIVVMAAIAVSEKGKQGDLQEVVSKVVGATRHVVATTLTTIAGFTPLILDGGEFWPPMAICIAGGVTGATLLALVMVPALMRALAIGSVFGIKATSKSVAEPAGPHVSPQLAMK